MLLSRTNAAEVVPRNAVVLRIVTPSVDTAAADRFCEPTGISGACVCDARMEEAAACA
jgi:hypothetical protein